MDDDCLEYSMSCMYNREWCEVCMHPGLASIAGGRWLPKRVDEIYIHGAVGA